MSEPTLFDTAVKVAPAFRDKFDFSDPKNYDQLADHAFLAAEALHRKWDAVKPKAEIPTPKEAKK